MNSRPQSSRYCRNAGRTLADKRRWVAVLGGLASFLIIGATGLAALRLGWADYARAEPTKAYTFGMLIARLTIALIASATAGVVATKIARTGAGAAWWVGVFLLAGSAPIHLVTQWADYRAWYHFAYLLPLIPVTGLSGAFVTATRSRRGQR